MSHFVLTFTGFCFQNKNCSYWARSHLINRSFSDFSGLCPLRKRERDYVPTTQAYNVRSRCCDVAVRLSDQGRGKPEMSTRSEKRDPFSFSRTSRSIWIGGGGSLRHAPLSTASTLPVIVILILVVYIFHYGSGQLVRKHYLGYGSNLIS